MRFVFGLLFTWALIVVTLPFVNAVQAQSDTGKVLSIREIELKEGADTAAFERFIRERYNPAFDGAIPGFTAYIVRGDRGEGKGRYLLVYEFDSARTRNAMFPEDGGGLSETFAPFFEQLPDFSAEFGTFVVVEEAPRRYTDYVMVK